MAGVCTGGGTGGAPATGGTGGAGGIATGGAGAATGGDGTGGTGVNPTCPGDVANAYQGTPGQVPGTIEAEDFDTTGYSDSSTGNEGGAYRTDVDVDIKALGAGYAIGWMTNGEWLEYTVNVATTGDYTLTVLTGAVDAGRTLQFSECGTSLATVAVPQIAAWGDMATATATLRLEAGLQVIRVTVGANDYVDFDSFTLTIGSPGTGGAGGTGGAATGGAATGGAATGGAATGGVTSCSTGTAQAGDVTVSLSSLQQRISGFGVSSAWAGNFRDAQRDPDMLWSTTTGAGLTLHRIRIGGGTTSETTIAKKAVEYGVKVWATPWEVNSADTDRANCPGNSSCTPPPKLINPQDWASRLVNFVHTMEAAGVPIYAISAENEPDSNGMNGTTSFTATELADWIGNYLGPALATTNTKVMAPETMNWYGFPSYFTAIQNNSAAWQHVSIFASHAYGLGPSRTEPAIVNAGKEYWQTEVDTGKASDDPTGDNISTALHTAQEMHNHLTLGNLNAWHYWWLWAGGTSGLYDTDTNVWTKRLWVMGNFSRFVRPGYMRVSTSGSFPSGVLISAYTNQADGTVVVVAINQNGSATPVALFVSGAAPCSVTPWVTSASDNLAARSPITVSNARFTATLDAKSVTTFVGKP
jgi:glucuronoarabinoxylan endo-1,4-beta-xylanase